MIRFVNSNTPIDFTNVNSIPATQEFNLISLENENADGPIRYSTRAAKFFNVNNLTLLFEKSNGSPFIEINYLGFEGEFVQVILIHLYTHTFIINFNFYF